MILAEPQPEAGRWQAIAFSVLVHGFLLAFLFFGVQWKRNVPNVAVAELWSSRPGPAVTSAPPPVHVAPPPIAAPPVREIKQPDPVPETVVKPEIPVEKVKTQPVKKKVDPSPQTTPVKTDAPSRLPPRSWDADLNKEITSVKVDGEKAGLAASAANQRALASWIDRIAGKIRGNTVQPPNLQGNPVAVFSVNLFVTGDVNSVKLKRSSGVRSWDEAAERAILKSSPLPKPDDDAVFRRDLELILCPDERGCR